MTKNFNRMERQGYPKLMAQGLMRRFKLFFGSEFFGSRVVLWLMGLGFFANLANWAILFIFIKPVDSSIILHYNVYFGVDMMGNWKLALFMPLIGLMLLFINISFAHFFYRKKERIASHILLMAGLMIQLSLIIASISVIIINY